MRPRPIYQRHPGQSVTMPCVAVGDPKPTIVWRKVMPIVVTRPHRSKTYVDAAYCYRPGSVVCPSVCRSLSLSVTLVIPAKTAEPIEMPFGLRSDGPRDGVQILPCKGAILRGKGGPIVKYRDTLWSSVQKQLNRSRCRSGRGLGWT